MFQGGERRPPGREVDRPPVVGIDEAVLPQLGALVDVGHPGDGELHQLLGQRVVARVRIESRDQPGELRGDVAVDDGVQPTVHRGLERGVGIVPRRVRGGLADRFLGVRVQPCAQLAGDHAVGGPHPEDVLPQEQRRRRVG